MPASQRAFLHALAEDFGLDSESLDPEPHRHVVVFKAPRFVRAPMKTLAQCVAVRPEDKRGENQKSATAAAAPATSVDAVPFNAFILRQPRFGLTIDDVRTALAAEVEAAADWNIAFLPSEEVVLRGGVGVDEAALSRLRPLVARAVAAKGIAKRTAMCAVDGSLNVVRGEEGDGAGEGGGGGWSQVVRGAPVRRKVEGGGLGAKSGFAVLGARREEGKEKEKERRRREREESVVENWEDAVDESGEAGEVAGAGETPEAAGDAEIDAAEEKCDGAGDGESVAVRQA